MSDRAARQAIKASIALLRKERQAIAWDANCARIYETGNPYQERCLSRYNELTAQIEALEASLSQPAPAAKPPALRASRTEKKQIAFAFDEKEL